MLLLNESFVILLVYQQAANKTLYDLKYLFCKDLPQHSFTLANFSFYHLFVFTPTET